jgi:HSP20 family molecular chaperone IbpA
MNFLENKTVLRNLLFQGDQLNTIAGGVANVTLQTEKREDGLVLTLNAPGVSPEAMHVLADQQSVQVYVVPNQEAVMGKGLPVIPLFNQIMKIPAFLNTEEIQAVHSGKELNIFIPIGGNNSFGEKKEINIQQL